MARKLHSHVEFGLQERRVQGLHWYFHYEMAVCSSLFVVVVFVFLVRGLLLRVCLRNIAELSIVPVLLLL